MIGLLEALSSSLALGGQLLLVVVPGLVGVVILARFVPAGARRLSVVLALLAVTSIGSALVWLQHRSAAEAVAKSDAEVDAVQTHVKADDEHIAEDEGRVNALAEQRRSLDESAQAEEAAATEAAKRAAQERSAIEALDRKIEADANQLQAAGGDQ